MMERPCPGVSSTAGRSAGSVVHVAGDLVQPRALCILAPSSLAAADPFQRGKADGLGFVCTAWNQHC